MEGSFLEFELDFFRNFFSTASEEETEFNYNTINHQKSILSPYSIGICLCYLISLIKSNDAREKVAKEFFGIDLKNLHKEESQNDENQQVDQSESNNIVDIFIKEVFKLIHKVEDQKDTPIASQSRKSNNNLSNALISRHVNENHTLLKRNFFTVNLAFSLLNPSLLSPDSEYFQNSNAIQRLNYIDHPVYKIINKTVKKLTLGNINDLMNPLMHFTDNSIAFSSLLYFEDKFNENNRFDSKETNIFHTFTATRRRRSTIMGQKSIKAQHNESQNFCLYCHQSNPKIMTSSQSFTSLYQHTSSNIKVEMMKMTGKSPLCNERSKNYFAVELPMSDSKFSLVCVIPRNKGEESFTNLIQNMTCREFHSILNNMEPMPYDICIPFFTFNTESFDLISPLTEYESHKMFLFNNSVANSEEEINIQLNYESTFSEQNDTKTKKKSSKNKKKKKKKRTTEKSKGSSNGNFEIGDSNEFISDTSDKLVSSNNNNDNEDDKYIYCPHCGARKLRNDSMMGKECMLKHIILNENTFLHHFRQKCSFSVNLNGIGKNSISVSSTKSNIFSSWSSNSSNSSHSSFESIIDNENNYQPETEKDVIRSKGKKKKEKQVKKIFDHPFIFFLTRRNPDIIIQYGVVTVPTLNDDSFLY